MNTTTKTFTPLFYGDWKNVLMIHFAVKPEAIQASIPLELDTLNGEAFITLVAFRQENLKFAKLGPWARILTWPMASHSFLNIRTYVKNGDEQGIHFITEFVDNLPARATGPFLYGLPYFLAKIDYNLKVEANIFTGNVRGKKGKFTFAARINPTAQEPAKHGTIEHFLHERYNAYNTRHGDILKFHVDHAPWKMHPTKIDFKATGEAFNWLPGGRFAGANFTRGFTKVGLGRPVLLVVK